MCSRYKTFNALLEISSRLSVWADRGMMLGCLLIAILLIFLRFVDRKSLQTGIIPAASRAPQQFSGDDTGGLAPVQDRLIIRSPARSGPPLPSSSGSGRRPLTAVTGVRAEAGDAGRQTRERSECARRVSREAAHRNQRSWSTDAVGEAAQLPFNPFHPSPPNTKKSLYNQFVIKAFFL